MQGAGAGSDMNETGSRVLVIGYGEVGHAMEHLLSARHRMQFWDIRPVEGHDPVELEPAVAEADLVLFCVPVIPLDELATRIRPHLSDDCISLTVAKGLDERGRPAPAIFADVYAGTRHYGVLYGPMIAEEIVHGRPAFAQVGCSSAGIYARIEALFGDSALSLEYSDDFPGIAWSSLLKNVYAILFGAADELGLGDNVRGYLAVAAIREMADIVVSMGGQAGTVLNLAGLGDLVTTATSASSHHHGIGQQLARGSQHGISGEGTHTLAMVEAHRLFDAGAFPLFSLVRDMVRQPAAAAQRLQAWLQDL